MTEYSPFCVSRFVFRISRDLKIWNLRFEDFEFHK